MARSRSNARRAAGRLLLATTAALALLVVVPVGEVAAAGPEYLDPTTTEDSSAPASELTLREAFEAAEASASAAIIRLAPGADYVLDDCQAGALDYFDTEGRSLLIIGRGATINQTCAAESVIRLRSTTTSSTWLASDVSVQGGRAGGIVATRGTLFVAGSTVRDNSAPGLRGGGIRMHLGALHVVNSTISDNSAWAGGGIATTDSELHVTTSTIADNTATNGDGGGVKVAGSFDWVGDVTFTDSEVRSNTAESGSGGGIYLDGSDSDQELRITDVDIVHNVANPASAVVTYISDDAPNPTAYSWAGGGGVYAHTPRLTIEDSTLEHNTTTAGGGGLWYEVPRFAPFRSVIRGTTIGRNTAGHIGGGLGVGPLRFQPFAFAGELLTVEESTVAFNDASLVGGGLVLGEPTATTLLNSTVTNNSATDGGGVWAVGWLISDHTTLHRNRAYSGANLASVPGASLVNSVVGTPLDSASCSTLEFSPDNPRSFPRPSVVGMGSFSADKSCEIVGFDPSDPGANIVDGGNPRLGPLADNGGTTKNHEPRADSPLVDQAITGLWCRPTDQRGVERPRGSHCDIGAVER